jgi:hypothetical protein
MQVTFSADFAQDGQRESLIIVNASPLRTQTKFPFHKFTIPPHTLVEQNVHTLAVPVIGKKGSDWVGRIEFTDQFGRKYKSGEVTFTWAGPAEKPK